MSSSGVAGCFSRLSRVSVETSVSYCFSNDHKGQRRAQHPLLYRCPQKSGCYRRVDAIEAVLTLVDQLVQVRILLRQLLQIRLFAGKTHR